MKNFLLRNLIFSVILILVTIGLVNMVMNPGAHTQRLTYPQYKEKLAKGQISEVVVREGKMYHIEGNSQGHLEKAFETQGLKGSIVLQKLHTIVTSFSPLVMILLLLFFLLNLARGLGSQVMNFGKNHLKLYNLNSEPRGGQG